MDVGVEYRQLTVASTFFCLLLVPSVEMPTLGGENKVMKVRRKRWWQFDLKFSLEKHGCDHTATPGPRLAGCQAVMVILQPCQFLLVVTKGGKGHVICFLQSLFIDSIGVYEQCQKARRP